MRLATRYALFGVLVGLLAPAGLLVYALATRRWFDPVAFSAALAAGGTIVFGVIGSMIGRRDEILLRRNSELAALSGKLAELSTTDALTGIDNRRSFDERLAMEMARAQRYDVPCALVMIDLDRFKAVNDRHGHQAGDEVLRHVAALVNSERRSGDMVARYGGEELAAILPHTSAADAAAWAERVRTRLEKRADPLARRRPPGHGVVRRRVRSPAGGARRGAHRGLRSRPVRRQAARWERRRGERDVSTQTRAR